MNELNLQNYNELYVHKELNNSYSKLFNKMNNNIKKY